MITSKAQKKLGKILEDLGFFVDYEVAVGPYSLDCYCFEAHVGFELDSKYTHMSKKRDKKRDDWIWENYKIPICRVDETELSDEEAVKTKLLKFIGVWNDGKGRRGGFIPRSHGEM
jgi:very-short-patch-repair endonuclease